MRWTLDTGHSAVVVMQLVVRDHLAMIVAPVQRHVECEGQQSHGAEGN